MGVGGGSAARFPISFDRAYRVLSQLLGLSPASSYIDVDAGQVEARMGWAFRSRFPRATIASISALDIRPLSRGVHGFAGRWLVNGSGRGLVSIELEPPQRAYLIGIPVSLRQLVVSVSEPAGLISALSGASRA